MSQLKIHSISNHFFRGRWIYLASIVTIFVLFPFLSPDLPSLPTPKGSQNMVKDHSHNLAAPIRLFTEFGAIRLAINDIIIMAAGKDNPGIKTDFMKISNNFLQERLQSLTETSKQFPKDLENQTFLAVENSLNALKQKVNEISSDNGKIFEKGLEKYLIAIGIWFKRISNTYDQVMKQRNEQCSRKMKILEEKISRQIYETQHGEVCKRNTTVLHFRETAA